MTDWSDTRATPQPAPGLDEKALEIAQKARAHGGMDRVNGDLVKKHVLSYLAALPSPATAGEATLEGTWPRGVHRAFVDGAKWWQFEEYGSTMFSAERAEAEAEAVRRYGDPSAPPLPAVPPLSFEAQDELRDRADRAYRYLQTHSVEPREDRCVGNADAWDFAEALCDLYPRFISRPPVVPPASPAASASLAAIRKSLASLKASLNPLDHGLLADVSQRVEAAFAAPAPEEVEAAIEAAIDEYGEAMFWEDGFSKPADQFSQRTRVAHARLLALTLPSAPNGDGEAGEAVEWYPQGFAAQLRRALATSGTGPVVLDRCTVDSLATMIEMHAPAALPSAGADRERITAAMIDAGAEALDPGLWNATNPHDVPFNALDRDGLREKASRVLVAALPSRSPETPNGQ